MSHSGIPTVTPPKSEKITTEKEQSFSSMNEKRKILERVKGNIGFLDLVRQSLTIVAFALTVAFIMFVWVPYKVYGMSIYTILLVSHSLSFSCLFFVHIYLLPPLIHERYIISFEVEGKIRYRPVYHLSKNELYWCYQKLLQEKDKVLMELLQEKNKENERLRKENEEANDKTNGSPSKTKTPKKGNKSAGRSY